MAEQYIIENVEALWPKLDQTYVYDQKVKRSVPCNPRDQNAEFSIAFRMKENTAKALFMQMKAAYDANKGDAWEPKLANPFVKDDNGTYTHKSVIKGAYKGQVTNKPIQFDSQGNTMPDEFQLTTGSTVNVCVQLIPYDFGGKQSVSLRLKAVQVINLIPMEIRNPFSKVEGGFTIDDTNPFAASSKPTKSNNVLDDMASTGFDEEAPVKKIAKKATTPPPASDEVELGAIIENWDD